MRAAYSRSNQTVEQLINRIWTMQQVTRQEHLYLTSCLLAGACVTDATRLQINQVLDSIHHGRLQLLD